LSPSQYLAGGALQLTWAHGASVHWPSLQAVSHATSVEAKVQVGVLFSAVQLPTRLYFLKVVSSTHTASGGSAHVNP
jgi:hypothetical protein